MAGIETFKFSFGGHRHTLCINPRKEPAMTQVATREFPTAAARSDDPIAAELEAYNRAFTELELPWRWDAGTFRDLLRVAADRDCVGAYIERNQPHLLRVYEKAFLRDLVQSAKDRCQRER
jgi:hypothetical protein